MNARIERLTARTMAGEMFPRTVSIDYDREDFFLSPVARSAKRVREYILAQEPVLREESAL